jgi:hypothetical protein
VSDGFCNTTDDQQGPVGECWISGELSRRLGTSPVVEPLAAVEAARATRPASLGTARFVCNVTGQVRSLREREIQAARFDAVP